MKKLINMYEETINICNFICPACNCEEYVYYGNYKRTIVYYEEGILKEEVIKIKRLKCKKCGKTHAVIPDFILPYKTYSLNTILYVLDKTTILSKKQIEKTKNISRSLILYWQKIILKCINKLMTMYETFEERSILKIIRNELNIIEKYYIKYNEIITVNRKGIFYKYVST